MLCKLWTPFPDVPQYFRNEGFEGHKHNFNRISIQTVPYLIQTDKVKIRHHFEYRLWTLPCLANSWFYLPRIYDQAVSSDHEYFLIFSKHFTIYRQYPPIWCPLIRLTTDIRATFKCLVKRKKNTTKILFPTYVLLNNHERPVSLKKVHI